MLQKRFDELFASAYSVSVFTDWVDHAQLWTKERTDEAPVDHAALHDGVAAVQQHHPIPGVSAEACTDQGDKPGRWDERLPHFRAGAVPSAGAEVQSEFFVARSHATDAIAALRTIGDQLAPHLMISEIRTVRADDLWLSPQYERDCVGFHFTWHHDVDAAHHAGRLVVDTLAPFHPLPHWGKVFDPSQFTFPALYPKLTEAHRVFTAADPSGTFRNRWMDATFG
ncbi:MAG: D-arabinono-1,4-lactone oxidase [Acidimicrobiales bacterium]|nr:D-arabinono-1,4-lactone oxidase [Acidimicrobiales bacterium]